MKSLTFLLTSSGDRYTEFQKHVVKNLGLHESRLDECGEMNRTGFTSVSFAVHTIFDSKVLKFSVPYMVFLPNGKLRYSLFLKE